MNRAERAQIVSDILDNQYKKIPVPLDHSDPFTLLIAVLLSAHCTDERVNKITPILFKKANNPEKMRKLTEKQIYNIIRPCGLGPQKSKAIKKLSDILVKDFNGNVPCELIELEKLPGVGHKTASVVVAQAFNIPSFPVDTHIHRLAQRWGLSKGKNVKQTEKDLKKIFPVDKWNKLHLQIIFWGREFCQARACWGLECKVCKTCFPRRKSKFKHNKP